MKIGDTLYRFDGNYRIYPKTEGNRLPRGGPIYREHFRPQIIVGETRVSWIVGSAGYKVSKKDMSCPAGRQFGGGGFFTAEQMEADIWLHENRYKIVRMIERCEVEKLKKIAAILGYEDRPQ